jgi:hypothetical protein
MVPGISCNPYFLRQLDRLQVGVAGFKGLSKNALQGQTDRRRKEGFTQMLLRLSGGPASVSRQNAFNSLGMQIALVLPCSMLLLVPVGLYSLNWFFPALMVLVGAHYLPFATLYGMRMFLAGILIAAGVVIAHYFSGTFSLGHGSRD